MFFKLGLSPNSLFFKLGLSIVLFIIFLTSVFLYQTNYDWESQDSTFDAHEMYYYSFVVRSWGNPPSLNLFKEHLNNLNMWGGVFNRDTTNYATETGNVIWANIPSEINLNSFSNWVTSKELTDEHNITIPLYVIFGSVEYLNNNSEYEGLPTTVVQNDDLIYFFIIKNNEPSDFPNYQNAFYLTLIFVVCFWLLMRKYLYPIILMKNRVRALEKGDLDSEIKILGNDELAELTITINRLIKDIKKLLAQKNQLLLDVSHELRSPLARMKFLLEMMPNHKNMLKLNKEIDFLEELISNLLLSDRLSAPYSNLDLETTSLKLLINNVLKMFPNKKKNITVKNMLDIDINVDVLKFSICLRNLIDNALKYSKKNINLIIKKTNNILTITIQDFGPGIKKEELEKIVNPFYRTNTNIAGFGLGLTICSKIIQSHGGNLKIKSELNKGSYFSLILPL